MLLHLPRLPDFPLKVSHPGTDLALLCLAFKIEIDFPYSSIEVKLVIVEAWLCCVKGVGSGFYLLTKNVSVDQNHYM